MALFHFLFLHSEIFISILLYMHAIVGVGGSLFANCRKRNKIAKEKNLKSNELMKLSTFLSNFKRQRTSQENVNVCTHFIHKNSIFSRRLVDANRERSHRRQKKEDVTDTQSIA